MNYSGRGAAAIAEMSPFSRPYNSSEHHGNMQSWTPAPAPIVGFDAGTFLSTNKVACAIGAALLAGGIAYYYGYR